MHVQVDLQFIMSIKVKHEKKFYNIINLAIVDYFMKKDIKEVEDYVKTEPLMTKLRKVKPGTKIKFRRFKTLPAKDARDKNDRHHKKMKDNAEKILHDAKDAMDKQVGGSHYKKMKIQVVEFCHKNNIPFNEGCAIKYLCRWREKDGIKDLKKAKHYIDMIIEMEEMEE